MTWNDAGAFVVTVTVTNRRGLHARAAAKFVKLAETFDADVRVTRNGTTVGGRSIMGLMTLAASIGTDLTIEATGPEAEAAGVGLADLVDRGFDEL